MASSATQVGLTWVLDVTAGVYEMLEVTTCPYCNNQAMSAIRKLFFGPALSAHCGSCGKRVGVPPAAILAVTPFIFSILLAGFLAQRGLQLSALSLIAGFLATVAIHTLLVPLVARDA